MDNLEFDKKKNQIFYWRKVKKIKKNISKINFNEESKTEIQILIDYYNMIALKEPKVFLSNCEAIK